MFRNTIHPEGVIESNSVLFKIWPQIFHYNRGRRAFFLESRLTRWIIYIARVTKPACLLPGAGEVTIQRKLGISSYLSSLISVFQMKYMSTCRESSPWVGRRSVALLVMEGRSFRETHCTLDSLNTMPLFYNSTLHLAFLRFYLEGLAHVASHSIIA